MTEQSMKRGAKRATHSMMRSWFELEWIGMGEQRVGSLGVSESV